MLKRLIFLTSSWLALGLMLSFGDLRIGWSIFLVLGLVLITAVAIVGGVMDRRVRVVQQAMTSTRSFPITGPTERTKSAIEPPELEIRVITAKDLPIGAQELQQVARDANVFGLKPLNILHLWLFEDSGQARLSLHLNSSWGEIGTVHLLLCAEGAAGRLYSDAERSGTLEDLVLATEDGVDAAVSAFSYQPDLQPPRKRLITTIVNEFDRSDLGRGEYGVYPVNRLLCRDDVWQYAIDQMLARADLVTMDVTSFGEDDDVGAAYEIGKLIDSVPLNQVAFLINTELKPTFGTKTMKADAGNQFCSADAKAFETTLRKIWKTVALDSPNREAPQPVAHVIRSGDFMDRSEPRRIAQYFYSLRSQGEPRLAANGR